MKNLMNRIKAFIHDEDGMEFIQVAVIIVAVGVLAVIVYQLYKSTGEKIKVASEKIDLDSLNGWSKPE